MKHIALRFPAYMRKHRYINAIYIKVIFIFVDFSAALLMNVQQSGASTSGTRAVPRRRVWQCKAKFLTTGTKPRTTVDQLKLWGEAPKATGSQHG